MSTYKIIYVHNPWQLYMGESTLWWNKMGSWKSTSDSKYSVFKVFKKNDVERSKHGWGTKNNCLSLYIVNPLTQNMLL